MTPSEAEPHNEANSLLVALGEYDTGWHDPAGSLASLSGLAHRARATGAQLLVVPEMCTTGFTVDAERYSETEDGLSTTAISTIAANNQLYIVAGLSMRRDERYVNSAVAFAPDGKVLATYDKQRLFAYATEHEVYSPGSGPCVVSLGPVRVALFVCFDLRFPELFRQVARDVDAIVLVANWPSTRQKHWEVLTQARAIENQCYVVAVNRTGTADGLEYVGGSVIYDPWGARIDAPSIDSALRLGPVSHSKVAQVRKSFPLDLGPEVTSDRKTVSPRRVEPTF
ncbi:MAG TPA: nitrilase-related carbon-nitrogen hydrolase [Gemmatimonadaceae bacterium]|nr:nitrilase-related carbon-nitrogen hydrolase [Gemmatimonadaceae bacterium]